MKKRSILSIILVLLICVTYVVPSSAAFILGDVDSDGSVTSSDARLTLRASVDLEKFTEEETFTADADEDGNISSADARLILRASVGLEKLVHTHNYTEAETIRNATCTQKGEKKLTCRCGEITTEEIPLKMHTFRKFTVETAASAAEYGSGYSECSVCELRKAVKLCTHSPTSLALEGITECNVKGCDGQFPAFNDIVNALKAPGSINYFYGFTKTVTVTPKPECKPSSILHLALAELMEGLLTDSIAPGTVTEYSDFTNRRHINNATFFVTGTPYISSLSDSEVKSVSVQKMNGVDFVKNLPNSFKSTASGASYDLTKIKNSVIGDVYKVTVTLNKETMTDTNMPTGTTPIEKILSATYNEGLKKNLQSVSSSFDEIPEMANMMKMEMSIETAGTVSYYFTTNDFSPVAARYDIDMNTDSKMSTYFNNLLIPTKEATTTLTIESDTKQENIFFFNNFFTVK